MLQGLLHLLLCAAPWLSPPSLTAQLLAVQHGQHLPCQLRHDASSHLQQSMQQQPQHNSGDEPGWGVD
jgi:hypothetical protein